MDTFLLETEALFSPSPVQASSSATTVPKRPTFLNLGDLGPSLTDSFNVCEKSSPDSGYSTRFVSPESEVPPCVEDVPFDFAELWKQLNGLVGKPSESLEYTAKDLTNSEPEIPAKNAESLITEPAADIQYVGQPCIFWLKPQPEIIYECFADGPSGFRYQVETHYIHTLGQYKCGFVPIKPGIHEISVFAVNKEWKEFGYQDKMDDEGFVDERNKKLTNEGIKVTGSPFVVNVCRNYGIASYRRPILNIDMEMFDMGLVMRRKPWGIATNVKKEQVIVTDREQHQVILYGPDGSTELTFGDFGEQTGQFRRPTGVAFDAVLDRIYITDKDNHRVQVFSSMGKFIFAFGFRGRSNGAFSFPWGIAVSKCGKMICVADSRNHRLQLFDMNGQFIRKYSDGGKFFEYPRGVDFDATGKYIYATDFNLHHVVRINVEFTSCEIVVDNTQLKRPQGIHIDENGQLLVISSRQHSVKVFSPTTGHLLHEITQVDSSDLDLPLNVVTLCAGFIAVLDMNGRISVF